MSDQTLIAVVGVNLTLVIVSCFYTILVAARRKRNANEIARLQSAVNAYEDHIHAYGVCPVHMPILILILPISPRVRGHYRVGPSRVCKRCMSDQLQLVRKDGDGGTVHRFPVYFV